MDQKILEHLKSGRENAISALKLAGLCGYSTVRKLQENIHKLRREVVILSATEGYYLPANDAEIKDFIQTLESRARNTFVALKSARRQLRQVLGQTVWEL